MSFPRAKANLRALEAKTEELLAKYSVLQQSPAAEQPAEEAALQTEIAQSLEKRKAAIQGLQQLAEADASSTKASQVARSEEVLADHTKDYERIKAQIAQERNRSNLLTFVRSDIESHRRSVTPNAATAEADYMLQERQRVENSNSLADNLLAQAYETRDEFLRQRASLVNVNRRIAAAASHIPGLSTVISKINTRKKRDSLILATLVSLCVLFIFFIR